MRTAGASRLCSNGYAYANALITLTGVSVILIIGHQQSIVLGGGGLLRKVLILDLSKLDHDDGWLNIYERWLEEWIKCRTNSTELSVEGTEREVRALRLFCRAKAASKLGPVRRSTRDIIGLGKNTRDRVPGYVWTP